MTIILPVVTTIVTLAVSIAFFSADFANVWIKAGLFILLNAQSGLRLALLTRVPAQTNTAIVFRLWSIANVIAGCLGIIGSLVLGGGIGWLGVFISLGIVWVGGFMFFKARTFRLPPAEGSGE